MAKLNVQQFGMKCHFNMEHGNTGIYSGYINQPGHELHGKEIVKTVHTPKTSKDGPPYKFGKAEVTWYIQDGTTQPQRFNSLPLMMDHYKLKSEA